MRGRQLKSANPNDHEKPAGSGPSNRMVGWWKKLLSLVRSGIIVDQ